MHVVIIGASGGIGSALTHTIAARPDIRQVHALSRSPATFDNDKIASNQIDILCEDSLAVAAQRIAATAQPVLVIVASSLLSTPDGLQPERSLRHQSLTAFERVFAANTFGPALVAKHFLPIMPRRGRAVFAALSARVGSISDNQLGGWHAYRASKAALNMLIRNYAIEQARRNPDFIAVGLHPGTVDTALSAPFQANVPDSQLFTPQASAERLLRVIESLTPEVTGKALDWAGKEIPA